MTIQDLYINQAEDIDLEVTVLQDNGAVLNMQNCNVYLIIHDGYGIVWAKFTKTNPGSGWQQLDTTQESIGILRANILTFITKDMKPGRYFAELRVRFLSLVAMDDFFYDIVETKRYAFSIRESLINKLPSLP